MVKPVIRPMVWPEFKAPPMYDDPAPQSDLETMDAFKLSAFKRYLGRVATANQGQSDDWKARLSTLLLDVQQELARRGIVDRPRPTGKS